MAKTKLFEAWSFRLQQPAPFDDPKYAGSKSMGFSQYNTSSTAQKSTLHAPTMRALLAYAKLVSATENGQSVDGLGAIGHQGTTYRISEYRSANKTDCVVFNPVTGKFNAAQVEDGTQALKPYSVGAGNGTGSGLLFCLMPVLNEDDEFRQKFQEFVSLLESGWADMDAAFECALTLCDNVYRRIENSKQLGSDGVKISIPTTGNISVITQMAMDSGNYAPTGASYGEFTIMQMSGTPTAKASSFQKEDFVAKYALSNRTLTARELAMVPTLPDWYIIPKEVVRVCEHAKVTTASSQPMRNFLFRGEAGTGKTMGAQAIAALAFGTQSVPKVDKIVGPGNIFVALAKKAVYGYVSIDSIAGPSEILVLADETANPRYVAADLLSQAEHDELASAILITTSEELAKEVSRQTKEFTEQLARKEIIQKSLDNYGYILVADTMEDAIDAANEIASEHMEILTKNPYETMTKIRHAGAIFLGNYSSEPLGDYFAGPNHVLPTNGTAKFFSPLSVDDYIKKSSIISYSREALEAVHKDIELFARKEGLTAHENSIKVRFE
mgnify:CR=1 FL=1